MYGRIPIPSSIIKQVIINFYSFLILLIEFLGEKLGKSRITVGETLLLERQACKKGVPIFVSYIFLLVGRVCNRVIFNLSTTFHRCPQVDCSRLKRELHPFIPLFPTKCYLLPNFASTLYSKMHNQAFFLVFCPRLDFSRQGNNAHLTCNQFWCSILRYLSLQILSVSMAHIQIILLYS